MLSNIFAASGDTDSPLMTVYKAEWAEQEAAFCNVPVISFHRGNQSEARQIVPKAGLGVFSLSVYFISTKTFTLLPFPPFIHRFKARKKDDKIFGEKMCNSKNLKIH